MAKYGSISWKIWSYCLSASMQNGEKKTHVVDYADIVALAELPPLAEALGRWAAISPGVLAYRLR